ncbi:hypothetical protein K2E96_21340 [Pseudomonas sp. ERGC3:05]|nr:hypothetical protein K2E96_21340 [Pseudomonas sp. ERGC3:05]
MLAADELNGVRRKIRRTSRSFFFKAEIERSIAQGMRGLDEMCAGIATDLRR